MKEYVRRRWFIDNQEKFDRILFVRRQSLLEEYVEENIYYYREGNIPTIGEKCNPLIKVRIKGKEVSINVKYLLDDTEYETYLAADFVQPTKADAEGFLDALGFVKGEHIQKKVSLYALKNERYTRISINEYKWGSYVKIIATPESMHRVAQKLDLFEEGYLKESILDVYRRYLLSHSLKIGTHISYR